MILHRKGLNLNEHKLNEHRMRIDVDDVKWWCYVGAVCRGLKNRRMSWVSSCVRSHCAWKELSWLMSSARAYFDRLLMLSLFGGRSALPAGVSSNWRVYHESIVLCMTMVDWSGVVVSVDECIN